MNQYNLMQYVWRCRPSASEDDIDELRMINDYDVLIVFKDGLKIIFDTFTNYFHRLRDNECLTDEEEMYEFRKKLESAINRRFITQGELADEIGTSQVMISRYVTGKSIPSVLIAKKIARALNCTIDELFYKHF